MTAPVFTSYEEFWPHYVGEHRDPINRLLHYVGTSCGVLGLVLGVLTLSPGFVLLAPVLGYGPAWVGHLLVEGNRPASWTYPSWSLRADFRMLALGLQARMTREVERLHGASPVQRERMA
ncbi:MAG: DUF962 domain-containing protein [bacterium]